jgi:hypothetical protein
MGYIHMTTMDYINSCDHLTFEVPINSKEVNCCFSLFSSDGTGFFRQEGEQGKVACMPIKGDNIT